MLDKAQLQQEIGTALAAPKTMDPLLDAKRHRGLQFIVEVHPHQSQADVAAAFQALSDHFAVEPLFPAADFAPTPPGQAPTWRDLTYIATVQSAAFDDVSASATDIAEAARAAGGLLSVMPDIPVAAPEPPSEATVESMNVPGVGWEYITMRIQKAWDYIKRKNDNKWGPGQGIFIGHPDTGWNRHDVWGRISPRPDFVPPNLDIRRSKNFVPGEGARDAQDPLTGIKPFNFSGHGNATAAAIVAPEKVTDLNGAHPRPNSLIGVAYNAMVIPIRCVRSVILVPGLAELARAIDYAREQGCRVISISLGQPVSYPYEPVNPKDPVYQAVQEAVKANIIVVAAAGQYAVEGTRWFRNTCYPARFPGCIGVAGIGGKEKGGDPENNFERWNWSHRNPERSIAISAPASPVWCADADENRTNSFVLGHGTSFSTAFIAGIAACWLSLHYRNGFTGPGTAHDVFRRLLWDTKRVPTGGEWFDPWFGGIVDAEAMMKTVPPGAKGA
jgi:hypothetical protein